MDRSELKKIFTSIYIIFIMISLGFLCVITINDIMDNGGVSGSSIIVAKSSNGDYNSIQIAINNANSGDTIYVWSGTYIENIVVNKKVNLIGNSSTNTTIDGGANGRVLKIVTDGVMVSGFSIINSGMSPSSPYDSGITLDHVKNVIIINNSCSNNFFGIHLIFSEYNQIINNTCNLNYFMGIFTFSSHFNYFINNTCNSSNIYDGIHIEDSNSNILMANICNYNKFSGIAIFDSHSNRVKNNTCHFNMNYFGVALENSDLNNIENNNLKANYFGGIRVLNSNFNIVKNNTYNRYNSSGADGISIQDSISNTFINNTMSSKCSINLFGGELQHWNTHTIDLSNTIDGKPIYYWKNRTGGTIASEASEVILANCNKMVIENLEFNVGFPIQLGFSSYNTIINNTLKEGATGLHLQSSNNNSMFNNDCDFNGVNGIWLEESDFNIITNNNCSYVGFKGFFGIGINLTSSDTNILSNNTCKNNTLYGIKLFDSKNNIISFNNISNNDCGILTKSSSNRNTIRNNDIYFNKLQGISIVNSHNSNIYFNNLINNTIQAKETVDSNNNHWDNGNNEGNYWSDYNGLDCGGIGRIIGDGIGDTDLQHLGIDAYPFMYHSGWLYPGLPRLIDPGEVDSDGNYSVSWYNNRGTDRFILEEDNNLEFDSPSLVYNGPALFHDLTSRPNGTYYYRLKALNDQFVSPWSNIVNITIDWHPNVPQNLTVSIYPEGNALNISWNLNKVDTMEYHLYCRNESMVDWIRKGIFAHPQASFNDSGLKDGVEYFYKLQAIDARGQLSEFCDNVSAIPNDSIPPAPPKGLAIISTSVNSIILEWEPNTEDDLAGYWLFQSRTQNTSDWGAPISSINSDMSQYIITGLDEASTYYYVITAFDEVPNNSSFSNIVYGTTLLGPYAPEINNSLKTVEMFEDTIDNTSINLYYWFKDKNNDHLTFKCKGQRNLEVNIDQETGVVTLSPKRDWSGTENLIFSASDIDDKISANITVIVTPLNDPPEQPRIISPADGLNITEGKKLDFECQCSDPDLAYGDELTFSWSSDISGDLGTGMKLNGTKLPVGEHEITLTVTDNSGNTSFTSINIKVSKQKSGAAPIAFEYISLIISVILILILIMVFFIIKKKRSYKHVRTRSTEMGITASNTKTIGMGPSLTSKSFSIQSGQVLNMSAQQSKGSGVISVSPILHKRSSQQTQYGTGQPELIKFQSKMVGRDTELKELEGYLEEASLGKGKSIFIYGEAGIGKTRLVSELKNVARLKGFRILSSNCQYESLTPYMPFLELLRSGGLDHLFSEEAPRVEAIYLLSESGLLISEVIREDTKLNPIIFTSMLTAVGNFVKESLSILSSEDKEGALNVLGFENHRIIIESSGNINIATIVTGKENDLLISELREILSSVTAHYGPILNDWDGVLDKIEGVENLLKPLITSGKYDGIYFGNIDPKTKKNLLFQNVFKGLIKESETTPILLCMEDLHWADPSSLALIYYISRNSGKSRILIIGTYRPEELTTETGLGQPLQETMQLMTREELLIKLELQRLPEECIDEIVVTMLGGTGISDDVRTLIFNETEGNPLFIIELVKFLGDEHVIVYTEGIWKLSPKISELSVPPKIYDVIDRRLSRLDVRYKELLDYASIIGETFSSFILASALNRERLELLSQLRDLEQKHRLIFTVNGNYRFAHAKIKEVVYSNIPIELRMEYHSIIANSIEKLNRDNLNEVVESLAFHYQQCKNKTKAVFYLTRAAQKARMNYSNSEAIRFYNEAFSQQDDPEQKRVILDSLGEIYDLMGNYDNSLEMYNRVLTLTTDPKKRADIKTRLGILYLKKGDYDKSILQSTEALQLVKNENIKESSLAFETLGYTYHRMGETDKALKQHKKSLDISGKLGDQKGIATSFKNIGICLMDKNEYDNALKHFNKGLSIFKKLGDFEGIQLCLNNIGDLYFNKGEYEKAFEYYDETYKIIEKTGDQSNIAILLLNIGHSLLQIGEVERALKNLNESLRISKANDLLMVTACNYWVLSEAYLEKGELVRALDLCNRAYNTSKELGAKEIIAALKRVFGIIYQKQNKWNISLENFSDSLKLFREIGDNKELGDTYYEFGLMWRAKGDINRAKEALKEAAEIFKKLKLDKKKEKVLRALGTL